MPTLLGISFMVVALFLTMQGRYSWVLSLGAAVPIGVVLSVGNNGVPVFYFFAIWVIIALLFSKRGSGEPRKLPGKAFLLAFAAWSVFVTAFSPGMFAGIPVLAPFGGIDSQLANPSALTYTASNIAQVAYMILGVGVLFYLGRARGLSRMFPAGALAGLTLLSSARLASIRFGTPFPNHFFDNSTGVSYVEGAADGTRRFRGIFAEPSELAMASLVAAVFFLASAPNLTGKAKFAALCLAGLATINMIESTATSALASVVVFTAIFSGYHCVRFIFLGGKVKYRTFVLVPLALPVVAIFTPSAIASVIDTVTGKTETASYSARTGSDVFSAGVFMDTWGLGAGLGSNRPASFLPMLLSTVGIVGAVLFITACVVLLRRSWAIHEARPAVWALVALMSAKCIASPNLSDPLIWLLLGVLANFVWSQTPVPQQPKILPPHSVRPSHSQS
ncbi:hypothetical protein NNX39_12245 [Arthrobacter sp. zg-Y826]|uniref:hypothetical protein n=1 Tax=Arthrobacter jinronghuae TaxID=2964609 RepID=UPI0021020576|nr:hypothetical protein [Arthrobacter jinronghuae]MCQ1957270.1 hypothetical protein [Arthrobacter jinronghuae]